MVLVFFLFLWGCWRGAGGGRKGREGETRGAMGGGRRGKEEAMADSFVCDVGTEFGGFEHFHMSTRGGKEAFGGWFAQCVGFRGCMEWVF